jgi:cytochrome c oxidase cbb3-type subunit I/II
MEHAVSTPVGMQGSSEAQPENETFSYNEGIVRLFVGATIFWGVVAFLVGLYVALMLVMPQLSFKLEYLTLGRIRPLHTNAAIFAFVGNAIFAGIYYSTQRLCKARMWSDTLGLLHFWGWQLIIVLDAICLPLGITQSKEYAEPEWPVDLLIAVVWLLFFGTNFFMTLVKRRERHMYVALWFYIATILTVTVLHVFNNLVVPIFAAGEIPIKSYPIYAGVQDAFMQWWYGHNAVAFFLTTPFLGLMYYFLPKAADRPVYSYKLSIIHFWSLVFLYIWAGPHHLHYSALPEWASTLGMIFSVMLWMPSWGGMINGLFTLRGAWAKVSADPVLKFFVAGITFYGMSTFEGPLLSIKSVNALSHNTDWTIAHVHSGALGWNGFITFGMIYWLLPRLYQTKLFSTKLATWHFWISTIGLAVYILPIYAAGLTQGLSLRALDESGQLANPDFLKTVQAILPMYWLRSIGGAMYIVGALLMVVNYLMTRASRPAKYEVPVYSAPKLSSVYIDAPAPESKLATVAEVAKTIDVWSKLTWHRRWERLPIRFSVWVLIAVIVASLFEIIPTFLIRANVPTISKVKPYTPLELAGRDIYVAEGCYGCHTQMIRPILAETKRYGEYSKPGEFIYDHPFQWGSRRVGPDLAREGGRQSNYWHYRHFINPQAMSKGSTMPIYDHLKNTKLNFKAIPERVRAARLLGAKYDFDDAASADIAMQQAVEVAGVLVEQGGPANLADRKIIALIAYMQRLGVDISRPDAPPPAVPPPGATPEATEPTADAAVDSEATAEDVSTSPVSTPLETPEVVKQ